MKAVSHNIAQARDIFKSIDWLAGSWEISWKPFKPGKSPEQKGLFYAWIREITKHLNEARLRVTESQIKELIKDQFGPSETVLNYKVQISTEDYKWDEMSDMLMQIQAWAATDLNLELRVKGGFERLIKENQ